MDSDKHEHVKHCSRNEAGCWFQRRGETYWKQRLMIFREHVVSGQAHAGATTSEERVLF